MKLRIACLAALFLATSAWAQTPPTPTGGTADLPFGAPYNVGAMAERERLDNAQVSLRDYLSSRIDQIGADLNGKIEQQQKIIDERDHQYAQRFDAQQEALSIQLSAAKEAVTKAEDASNKRFESVNEFRKQLDDQANTFIAKETAEARFAALEEKTASNTDRLNSLQASSAGSISTWALVGGAVFMIIAIATFVMAAMRFREPT